MTQTSWDRAAVELILEEKQNLPGALLPILHGIQKQLGYIPEDAVPLIADALNQSRAEIHGVITFYHYFRMTPPGKHTLHVCRAEACQAMNGAALEAHIKQTLGIDYHETTPDNAFSLEPVYCLGNCACAPSIMIDEEVHGRVSPERFDSIVHEVREFSA